MALGVRRSAGVLLEAGGRTRIVVVACGDALAAPFGADVVRYAQAVLGDVWLHVVAAKTAVLEGILARVSDNFFHNRGMQLRGCQ